MRDMWTPWSLTNHILWKKKEVCYYTHSHRERKRVINPEDSKEKMIKRRSNETETEEESGEKQNNTQREWTLCFSIHSTLLLLMHKHMHIHKGPRFYHLSTAAACNARYTHTRTEIQLSALYLRLSRNKGAGKTEGPWDLPVIHTLTHKYTLWHA